MKIRRRTLMGGLLALIPAVLQASTVEPRNGTGSDFELNFTALIDTFVPADDSPGAIDLGIDKWLLAKVSTNHEYLARVTEAVTMLQRIALQTENRAFHFMSLAERTRLVGLLLSKRQEGNTYLQLSSLHRKTITRYYTSEAAFQMLDYHPPSQGGYPDYDQPPV